MQTYIILPTPTRVYIIDISDLNLCGSMAMLSFGPKIAIGYSGYEQVRC